MRGAQDHSNNKQQVPHLVLLRSAAGSQLVLHSLILHTLHRQRQ